MAVCTSLKVKYDSLTVHDIIIDPNSLLLVTAMAATKHGGS